MTSLAEAADGVLKHLEAFRASAEEELAVHLPVLIAFAEKAQSSDIMQAVEESCLPPDVEAKVAADIRWLAAKFPPPAAPEPPAEPAEPGNADASVPQPEPAA
jgi:hypothetical protein